MLENGSLFFYMDLSKCRGLDSTFMGMLVDIHKKYRARNGCLWVSNPTANARKQLTTLGVTEIVDVRDYEKPEGFEFEEISVNAADFDSGSWLRFVKKSHENLVSIDHKNRKRFNMFLQNLQTEMQERNIQCNREEKQ